MIKVGFSFVSGYPSIHLIHGFMGFGKTTLSKRLEQNLPAVKLTHDDFMFARYGRDPEDFQTKYKIVDTDIRLMAEMEIKAGRNVIMDYGFWEKDTRKEYYEWAKILTPNVLFHALHCDLDIAKKRVLNRSASNENELLITPEIFYDRLKRFEPMTDEEGLPVIFYQTDCSAKQKGFEEDENK